MPTSMFSVSQTTITSDLMPVAVVVEELHQVLRADLFLALDDHLDVDRQRGCRSCGTRRWRRARREIAPLSSAAPRAKSRPSRRVSFHGSRLPLLDVS